MGKVIVVGAGRQQARLIDQSLADTAVRIKRQRWATFLREETPGRYSVRDLHSKQEAPELIIYDLEAADAPRTEVLTQLKTQMPDVSVLYLGRMDRDAKYLEWLEPVIAAPDVDFVLSPGGLDELRLRVHRLLARRRNTSVLSREPVRVSPITSQGVLQHTVPALRATNGRLDARAVSELFGLSLAALARALNRSEQTVHKTPSAVSVQEGLRLYERIAAALLRLTGSEEGVRMWMNAPNPELEGDTPQQLLLTGEGEVVADLLEAALTGEPA